MIRTISVALLLASLAFGQETSATLLGTATDPSGAATPEVLAVATVQVTNVYREAETDVTVTYSIPFLPAGQYPVSATRNGFQSLRTENVTLQVGQTARVDFQLQLGDVSQRVIVEGN